MRLKRAVCGSILGISTILLIILKILQSNKSFVSLKGDERQGVYIIPDWNQDSLRLNPSLDGVNICQNISKPEKSRYGPSSQWHLYARQDSTIFLHSAFYDDRPSSKQHSLKLLAVSDLTAVQNVFCNVWYNRATVPLVISARLVKMKGWKRKVPSKIYKYVKSRGIFEENVLSCPLPENTQIPVQVSVTTEECEQSDVILQVTIPKKVTAKSDFGLCVAISYGRVDLPLLVEWFELHKILGVHQFNIYNASMNSQAKSVFDYYELKGELVLNQMDPVIPSSDKQTVLFNSLASLNHCLYTNMHAYKHIVVVDFDEVIVPRDNISYGELIKRLNKIYSPEESWASYTFPNVYFFTDVTPDGTKPEYLPKIRFRMSNATSPYKYVPKSFIHPMNCEVLSNHNCLSRFHDPRSRLKRMTGVALNIARSHHYRKCGFPKDVPYYGQCPEYRQLLKQDDILLRYQNVLDKNVRNVLAFLNFFT